MVQQAAGPGGSFRRHPTRPQPGARGDPSLLRVLVGCPGLPATALCPLPCIFLGTGTPTHTHRLRRTSLPHHPSSRPCTQDQPQEMPTSTIQAARSPRPRPGVSREDPEVTLSRVRPQTSPELRAFEPRCTLAGRERDSPHRLTHPPAQGHRGRLHPSGLFSGAWSCCWGRRSPKSTNTGWRPGVRGGAWERRGCHPGV